MTYVAINLSKGAFLRKTKSGWYATTDLTAAYCNSAIRQLEDTILYLKNHGVDIDGWSVVSTSEASRLIPKKRKLDAEPILIEDASVVTAQKQSLPTKLPMVQAVTPVKKTLPLTPPSQNALEIIEQVKALNNLIQPQYRKLLSSQLSAVDKEIVDIYHYIEVTNFNACEGYKACKQLKNALIARRQIKNEMAVILHIDQCGLRGIERLEELSTRAWEAQRDILEGV